MDELVYWRSGGGGGGAVVPIVVCVSERSIALASVASEEATKMSAPTRMAAAVRM
jgi:hypothetical protein